MITSDDLLASGQGLLFGSNVTEADVRRAVSCFYYSLFHRLAATGAAPFAGGGMALAGQVTRAFNHSPMRRICEAYRRGTAFPPPLDSLVPNPPSVSILAICDGFIELQDARHEADYNLGATVTLQDGIRLWSTSRRAHASLLMLQGTAELTVFLAALLLHDKWTRRG